VSFAADAQHPEQGVCWTDGAGRHRVVTRAGQAPQLPVDLELNAGLMWWVERLDAAGQDTHDALIAALPTPAPSAPGDVHAITHAREQSGRMIVLANTRGRWQRLDVEEPRRG
jgi:hypothetical protein